MELVLEPTDMGWRWYLRGGDPRHMRDSGGLAASRTEAEARGRAELDLALERERAGDTGSAAVPSPVVVSGIPERQRADVAPPTAEPVAPAPPNPSAPPAAGS